MFERAFVLSKKHEKGKVFVALPHATRKASRLAEAFLWKVAAPKPRWLRVLF